MCVSLYITRVTTKLAIYGHNIITLKKGHFPSKRIVSLFDSNKEMVNCALFIDKNSGKNQRGRKIKEKLFFSVITENEKDSLVSSNILRFGSTHIKKHVHVWRQYKVKYHLSLTWKKFNKSKDGSTRCSPVIKYFSWFLGPIFFGETTLLTFVWDWRKNIYTQG